MHRRLEVLFDFPGCDNDRWQLKCKSGVLLHIKEQYDDGWSLVVHPDTKRQGIVPTSWTREVQIELSCSVSKVQNASSDPKFKKYRNMKKAGLPEGAIRNAMLRDGLKEPPGFFRDEIDNTSDTNIKPVANNIGYMNDPKYSKYNRMKNAGLPQGAILNAMKRDGVNPPASFFSTDSQASNNGQVYRSNKVKRSTVNPAYEKYSRMKSAGLPEGAIINAAKRDGVILPKYFFNETEQEQETTNSENNIDGNSDINNDPKYEKYRRMKKSGLPEGAILNSMNRDGITPPAGFFTTIDVPMVKQASKEAIDKGNGKYSKYRRMQKSGLPEGAILNAMQRDGVSPPANFFETDSDETDSTVETETQKPASGFLDGIKSFDKNKLQSAAVSTTAGTGTAGGFLDGIKGFDKNKLSSNSARTLRKNETQSISSPAESLLAGIKSVKLKRANSDKTTLTSSSTGKGAPSNQGKSMLDIIKERAQERQKRNNGDIRLSPKSSVLESPKLCLPKLKSPSIGKGKSLRNVHSNSLDSKPNKPSWMELKLKPTTPSSKKADPKIIPLS